MTLLVFFIGGALASFFVCLIERRDRSENWWLARSRCNECDTVLGTSELIPVLSFILLRGRSRCCHKPLPKKYLLIEIIGGFLLASIYIKYSQSRYLVPYSIAVMGLYLISLEDINSMSVYTIDYLIIFSMILISLKFFKLPIHWLSGLFFFSILYAIYLVFPGGLGNGDPQVGFMIGVLCPTVWTAYLSFTLSFVIGALFGIYILSKKGSIKDQIPFLPFLSLSFYILILI